MDFGIWPPLFIVDVEGSGATPPDLVEVATIPIVAADWRLTRLHRAAWWNPPAIGGGDHRVQELGCGVPSVSGVW
ncbi:hypothetical protein [Nonomuraea sp. NPDC003754]